MLRRRSIAIAIAAIGLMLSVLLLTAHQHPVGAQSTAKTIVEPPMTEAMHRGKQAFGKYCQECHGALAAGTDKGPTFLHRVYHPGHHGDGAFVLAARRGAKAHHWRFGDMKPVSGVTDDELKDIVRYVRALQKANGVY